MNSLPYESPKLAAIDWSAALAQHAPWIRKVVCSRVKRTSDIDDVVQEISAVVLRQETRPTHPDKVAPWLYGVATRQASNFLRREGRHERLLEDFSQRGTGPEVPPNPRDWVMHCERRESVENAMTALASEDREILLLKYTEDLSYRELAQLLDTTVKAIEHRLLKARNALRAQLQEKKPN